jgi:hypothetical protein
MAHVDAEWKHRYLMFLIKMRPQDKSGDEF